MFKLRKIASALASTLMIGSTIGLAAAASFPAPYVQNGNANVAIVYGSNAAPQDLVAVAQIQTHLSEKLAEQTATSGSGGGTGSSVSGGDFVLIAKSSDNLNLGDTMSGTFGITVDNEDLENLLADGTYMNDENTEYAYEQKLALYPLQLTHFADSDYDDKEPSIGFRLTSNTIVLNYTLDFTSSAESDVSSGDLVDFETTDITILGKSYYILDAKNGTDASYLGKITLLDSANTEIIAEGESTTVTVGDKTYDVSINFITDTSVKLTVDGQTTNSLSEGATYKLSDGTYVGIKDILYTSKESGTSKVEFSLGSGKLEIEPGQEIEVNDDSVEGMKGWFHRGSVSGSKQTLDKIVLQWSVPEEDYIAADSEITMPVFGALKFSMGAFIRPSQEEVSVDYDGDDSVKLMIPVKDGDASLNILYAGASGNFTGIGKDTDERLATSNTENLTFTQKDTSGNDYDAKFVASYATTSDAESYVLSARVFEQDSRNRTTIKNVVTGKDVCENKVATDSCDIGDVSLTIGEVYYNKANGHRYVNLTAGSNTNFKTIYSKEGLKVQLPYAAANGTAEGSIDLVTSGGIGTTAGHNVETFIVFFTEENKDGDIASGAKFNVTIGHDSDGDLHITDIATGSSELEIPGSDNDVVSVVSSALATEVKRVVSSDKGKAEITYSGGEAYAEVYLTDSSAEVMGGSSGTSTTTGGSVKKLGSVMTTDANAGSVSSKNLIVVGGSCVNTVAAQLLGVSAPTCGADWQSSTNVGAGQYLIQTFERTGGTVATLVAGYNAQDTTNAAAYLVNEAVMTDAGSKYIGTSATSAEMVTETSSASTETA